MARVKNRATGREREVHPEPSVAWLASFLSRNRIHDRSHDRVISTSSVFINHRGYKTSDVYPVAKECRRATRFFGAFSIVRWKAVESVFDNDKLVSFERIWNRDGSFRFGRASFFLRFNVIVLDAASKKWFLIIVEKNMQDLSFLIYLVSWEICAELRTGCSIFEKIETRDSFFCSFLK